ncbi:unnamed protein product [Withania somnifera]
MSKAKKGLLETSYVFSVCTLLCYGDADVHMACFDFLRITGAAMNHEIIPAERLIPLITAILRGDKDGLPVFCNIAYDSSIGGCLHVLYTNCPDEIVRSTSTDLTNVSPHSLLKTKSLDLKDALCFSYIRIAKSCPPHIWRPESLIHLLYSTTPIMPLVECFQVALSRLFPDLTGVESVNNGGKGLSDVHENSNAKHQKIDDENRYSSMKYKNVIKFSYGFGSLGEKQYSDHMHNSLTLFVKLLKPPSPESSSLGPEVALTALSTLCIVFCRYPQAELSIQIFCKMYEWANQKVPIPIDLRFFLEAVHNLLIIAGSLPNDSEYFKTKGVNLALMRSLVTLQWTRSQSTVPTHDRRQRSFLCVCFLKLGLYCKVEMIFDILDLGLRDTPEDVRIVDVISMPVILMWSGYGLLNTFSRGWSKILEKEAHGRINKVIPGCFGYLECLYGSCTTGVLRKCQCKFYLPKGNISLNMTMDDLVGGFWCSKCDINAGVRSNSSSTTNHDYVHLQSIFFRLLFDESSEDRMLLHGTESILLKTRSEWFICVDCLLIRRKKAIRESFSKQVSFFIEEPILNCLSKEQKFMDKIKYAVETADDSLVFATLLEATAEIMKVVDVQSQSFMFSLILLTDHLDSLHSCYFHLRGGFELILLASRPRMVEEFAVAILGTDTEELVRRMVPVVLPKLVVTQQDNEQAIFTLYVLAKCLKTDMVQLIVNWLPTVLMYALHRANDPELLSVLQFYHEQTGSDKQEIFAAALPALLYELVCFTDEDESNEISKRLMKVPPVIKEVSRILTGEEDIPVFLRNHFVGLLNSIDRKMLNAEDISLQRQAIRRIEMLISMMDSYVSTYVPKLMVLLMQAINKELLHGNGLSVLLLFIKQIARISPSSTKHVISQVSAALHISEFPPLPTIPALDRVNRMISAGRGMMTLNDQLRDIIDGLDHENLNVRYMVASELSKLLNLRREDIMALITKAGDANMDVMSALITSLLRGCAEQCRTMVGQWLKLICADCLGALGAIDPSKVKGFSSMRFQIACSDDDLIFEFIHKHLARVKLPVSVVDSKYAEVQERGQRLWNRFSSYVKEIITPCLTSRFQLPSMSDSTSSGPMYRPSMSFRRWIFFWIKKLTAHATGSRVSIFYACRGIVRHDMQIAMYLLPYLVLNAVCDGTKEAHCGITEEILSVLNAAASENSTDVVNGVSSGHNKVCIQAVFTHFDNLGQWVDDVQQELSLSQSIQTSSSKQRILKSKEKTINLPSDSDQVLSQCKHVSELLAAIHKMTLARASFRCHAYARSLLYFESHVRKKSGSFNPASEKSGLVEDEDISFLMEIYSGLDDPDGLCGFASLRKSKSLQDHLLVNKKAGNCAEVLTSCEQALQMEPTSVQSHSDVVHCLLNMCHLQATVTHVDGLVSRIPKYKKTWCMQGVQAAWRLGRWDLMDEYLNGNALFDMDVTKILQAIMKRDQFSVAKKITLSKQPYPFVVKLHMLQELEDYSSLLGGESFLEKSFVLYDLEIIAECWIQYAKLCRYAGHYETASRAILEAKASGAPNNHMEKAKLLWSTRRADGAIAELQQTLLNMPVEVLGSAAISSITSLSLVPLNPQPLLCGTQSSNENRGVAKILLLYSRWIHYTGQKQKEDVISLYSRVKELQPKSEKGYFYLAKYCDELLLDARKRQDDKEPCSKAVPANSTLVATKNMNTERSWWSYLPDVLLFYAKGLHRGLRNLFQALPRLLTLWFDFGSVMSVRRGCLNDFPTYQLLTVLPHLVSRICHQNEEIVRLPSQALWTMAAFSGMWSFLSLLRQAESSARSLVFGGKKSNEASVSSLFAQFAMLIDHLIKLCFHPGQTKARTINISTEFSALKRMMPIFYSADLPTISGIADEADILSSVQRPKKIILLGSDEIERPFLCKPKADLRKDARMMEFNAMVNRLLSKCSESRRRKLYIGTFVVIPLTEDCGMVEWVPHTLPGKMPEDEMLKNKILPMFPPAFHKWFLNTFSEPAAWFSARVAYAHTTAVWSMEGHIMGLGDRHGENILFDSTTGDCVHNMIDGLGITGYEGIFLKVFEITLSVLRAHRETLMSVLETFIHDPLVEWTKSHKSKLRSTVARNCCCCWCWSRTIIASSWKAKLVVRFFEAVSHKNLGKMYIWWMPWF